MNALVIYDSLYGNTCEIAEAIAEAIRPYGHVRVLPAGSVAVEEISAVDLLFIGGPTQRHGLSPKMEDLLDRIPPEAIRDTQAAAFDTRVHIAEWLSGSAADRITKKLRGLGCRAVLPAESFFVSGREGPLELGELERAKEWAHKALETLSTRELVAGGV